MNIVNKNPPNAILGKLSEKTFARVEPYLEDIEMPLTEILYHQYQRIEYLYFPETSVISIVSGLESGDGVEAGIIGREGVAGASILLADDISPNEATTQLGGIGKRMKVSDYKECFDNSIEFRNACLYYIYAFVAQISQNAACLAHHTIEKRLARWLLMFSDRAGKDQLILTQEFIALMLGVKRPSVSMNATKLQDMGLIKYNRGNIKILDREGMKNFSCECYEEINKALNGFVDSVI